MQECVVIQIFVPIGDVELGTHFYTGKVMETTLGSQTRSQKLLKTIVKTG